MSKKEKPAKAAFRCEWRDVVALNFEVDARLLRPLLPAGTVIDRYNDHTLLTLMAKNIREFRPWGKSFTLFRSIVEIDMRTYVAQEIDGELQRGHCKLQNFVSSKFGCRVLKWLSKQQQTYVQAKHTTTNFEDARSDAKPSADYRWTAGELENHFMVKARDRARKPQEGSKEEFVLQQRNRFIKTPKGTLRMPIRQAPWLVWNGSSGSFDCEPISLMDASFRKYLGKPNFVLMSRGGEVTVFKGERTDKS